MGRSYLVLTACYLLFLGYFVALSALGAAAQSPISPELGDEILGTAKQAAVVGLGEHSLTELDARLFALRIANGALGFVALVFVIFIIYGGFLYMTSQGNEEKTGTAKKVLTRAVIGMIIIGSSYGITKTVSRAMLRTTFESLLTQANSCSTSSGAATCCHEWNAFQNASTNVDASSDDVEEKYDEWQDCQDRAREAVGL